MYHLRFIHFASDEDISGKVDYEIEAHLETKEKMIIGNEIITWTNNSDRPLRAVYINLYMNAYKDKDTLFIKEFLKEIENRNGKEAREWVSRYLLQITPARHLQPIRIG